MGNTLAGYAIPVLSLHERRNAHATIKPDHTYVVGGSGKRWGCWGNDRGGKEICSGSGEEDYASEIAARADGTTGLGKYGLHGVCHQAANRILVACTDDVTVHKAAGYAISHSIYGTYGRDIWYPAKRGRRAFGKSAHHDKLHALYQARDFAPTTTVDEENALIREELGLSMKYNLSQMDYAPLLTKMVPIQERVLDEHRNICAEYERNTLSSAEFAQKINQSVTTMMREFSAAMQIRGGAFQHYFGLAEDLHSDTLIQLVDPALV